MNIQRIESTHCLPLHGTAATRALEAQLAAHLPPFALMSRAGASVAALTRALAPHAGRIWLACGPGNNGGDGLVAARHLFGHTANGGAEVVVTLCGDPGAMPHDAARALEEALASGIRIATEPPQRFDIGIDALLGIGARDAPQGRMAEQLVHLHSQGVPVLAVDTPSGLMADNGRYAGPVPRLSAGPRHTLSLLTLKPGLFTADGRDLAGTVWFDPLEEDHTGTAAPDAMLFGCDPLAREGQLHADHKGSRGDVLVVGGQGIAQGGAAMTGAAILAARASLHAGAGRVYVALLDRSGQPPAQWDPLCPELMFRSPDALQQPSALLRRSVVVCGCGGGSAVAAHLPILLSVSQSLVLDADGLNRTSEDSQLQSLLRARRSRGQVTVITPHPLEAARLLGSSTADVMNDRLSAAQALSRTFGAICVLKGSGTVVAAPGETPQINSSGNPALATAGTGDVLAGWIGARLATLQASGAAPCSRSPFEVVLQSVHAHGAQADRWVSRGAATLTASRLTQGPAPGLA